MRRNRSFLSATRKRAHSTAPDENSSEEKQSIVRAAAVLAAGNVASRLLGLARQTVKANLFGASGLLSAFEVAAFVPISLYELIIGGMVNAALVPVFSDYASKERRAELWGVLSTVLSVATMVLLLVVALVMLFAPQIAWMVGANEFDDPALTERFDQVDAHGGANDSISRHSQCADRRPFCPKTLQHTRFYWRGVQRHDRRCRAAAS